MLQLAKDLDAVGLHLFLLVPVGCGVEIAEEQMINATEYERVLNWLYDTEQSEPDLQLKATCAPHYFRVMRTRRAEERRNGVIHDLPASHDRQLNGHPHGQMHAATKVLFSWNWCDFCFASWGSLPMRLSTCRSWQRP